VVQAFHDADLVVLNLECCISERGSRWRARGKPFFFRAPPAAVELLGHLRVDCVTLGNNHALDFGYEALLDTFRHLEDAGIVWVGAGPSLERARTPVILGAAGLRLAVFGGSDHPRDFAATAEQGGIALLDLEQPDWLLEGVRSSAADGVLVTPHWGPNMARSPLPEVRRAADALLAAGATLVAGHSAHVFHGAAPGVLFDLGDFLDDYRVDPLLRNDLGILWLVDLELRQVQGEASRLVATRVEAMPLELCYACTRRARGDEADWISTRLREACSELGTQVHADEGRLFIDMDMTTT
jgi:hypothetical protein